ncbi:hypothetical protein EDB83DRAFT_2511756 [Lactarius deliciosus]|nr:hypothetical protein EDB83DRAFT_2511756 [Lactarius deliciosus]
MVYYPYSSSAVWQPQPVFAYPPSPMTIQVPVPVPVQVPVQIPVQVPVQVPVATPVAVSQSAFTPGTTFTVVQHSPANNTLHLEMVPSPRISRPIPPAPAPAPSPYRPPAPPPPAHDQWSQPQQVQVYSMSPQQQQQQHGSPPITINVFTTPQGQTLQPPANTLGPVHLPVLPTPAAPVTNDDDDAPSGDVTPVPIRIPNIPRHLVSTIVSISSPRSALPALVTSSPLPLLPTLYRT